MLLQLFRWRIFQSSTGDLFVMAAAADGTSRGPLGLRHLDVATIRFVPIGSDAAYELVGKPGYDDQAQYQLETGWSVDRNSRDVTLDVCRGLGVPEELLKNYTPARA